ncbi:hypothetical protein N8Z76_00285 [Gammaproteobacteria bacterium]|nr:hypothetical protein [Gammaproteobacteria bacterium]
MRYTADKEGFEKFSDELKKEYTEKDGVYTLNLEGHEDVLIPKEKKDIAEGHRKEAEKLQKEAELRVEELEKNQTKLMKDLEGASKADVEGIRKQHQESIDALKAEYKEREESQLKDQAKLLIKSEAEKFAGEKFTTPSLIAMAYAKRLTVDTVEGTQVIRVLEPDGKPSIKSVSELQAEFLDNAEFKSIVKVSSGSGGGANRQDGPGSGANGKTMSRSEFDTLTPEARNNVMAEGKTVLVDD